MSWFRKEKDTGYSTADAIAYQQDLDKIEREALLKQKWSSLTGRKAWEDYTVNELHKLFPPETTVVDLQRMSLELRIDEARLDLAALESEYELAEGHPYPDDRYPEDDRDPPKDLAWVYSQYLYRVLSTIDCSLTTKGGNTLIYTFAQKLPPLSDWNDLIDAMEEEHQKEYKAKQEQPTQGDQ